MRANLLSQLQSSMLLGALSLIPNNALRYTLLVISACLALLYAVHLKRPSDKLRQLEDIVQKTEEIIRDAKLYCARDFLSLAEMGVRLLEVKRSASMIKCRLLETTTLTWKKYRLFSRDISDCVKIVMNIQTTVELIVEAELQRRYTDDINETEIILRANVRPSPGRNLLASQYNIGNAQSFIHVLNFPDFPYYILFSTMLSTLSQLSFLYVVFSPGVFGWKCSSAEELRMRMYILLLFIHLPLSIFPLYNLIIVRMRPAEELLRPYS
ncbi:hypothetical protein FB451DRAFT_1552179, partial [Mycena latifolia]